MRRIILTPSLNGGELSPLLHGRVDVEKHGTGAYTLENLIPKVQGPIERRGGTLYRGSVAAPAERTALQRFWFNSDQAYILELSPERMRFWTGRGQLLNGSVPYEIAHSYGAADLFGSGGEFLPSSVQVRDVMFWARATQRPKALSRLGATSWTWGDFEYVNGPFKEENDTDTTMVLAAAVAVGAQTTCTASAAVFQAGHVGSLLELRGTGQAGTPSWKTGESIGAVGTARINDGRAYVSVNTGTTGPAAPTHTEGDVSDGAVVWRYAHARRVTVRIDSVPPGGLQAQVTLLSWPAGDVVTGIGAPVTTWSWGAWSSVEGWPTRVGLFRERLVFARGRTVWLSCAGDYGNFAARTGGEILAENAITAQIAVGRADEILWLQGGDVLLVGTEGGIVIIREQTAQLPFGPGNVKAIPGPAIGAAPVPPMEAAGGNVLYLDRTRAGLRSIEYSADSDAFGAPDATRLAEHILRPGILDLAYQAHRDSLIWGLRSDGELAALTWDSREGVYAWARHAVGGVVEAIECIPYPFDDLPRDDLWMVVRRTIGGQTVRYVEVLETPYVAPERRCGETRAQWWSRCSAAVKHALHLDCALTFDGVRSGSLSLPAAPLAQGETFTFAVTGGPTFAAGDVGKLIQHDYLDAAGMAQRAEARIRSVADGQATARIGWPFPVLAGNVTTSWRLAVKEVTGLEHLEGEKVGILADGAPYAPKVVTAGKVTIDPPAAVIRIGLPYRHRYVGLPSEKGGPAGSTQGRPQRLVQLFLRVFGALGARAGMREEDLGEVRDLLPFRKPETLMGRENPLCFGEAVLNAAGGYDRDSVAVVIEGADPLPFTLLSIAAEYEVGA